MYKLIKINESTATRTVVLENEVTGNRDVCFDDSALVSMNNFEFMKIGESYNCLIKLFGEIVYGVNQEAVYCRIISNEVIGCKIFKKVLVGKDIYYIPENKIQDETKQDFLFTYTRKDLIKVDNVVHDDLLNDWLDRIASKFILKC